MRYLVLTLAFIFCMATSAMAKAPLTQLPQDITVEEAQKVLNAALVKAVDQGVPMNIAVVDAGGNLKAFLRQDGAFLGSIDVSTKKQSPPAFSICPPRHWAKNHCLTNPFTALKSPTTVWLFSVAANLLSVTI